MKKIPTPPVYEVDFGRKLEDEPGMETVATFVVKGFLDDGVSRHDQVMAALGELPVPEDVDHLEMRRQRQAAAAENTAGIGVITRSGLVARPVGADSSVLEAVSSHQSAFRAEGRHAFPVQSIFERAKA
ncbi:MAG TPA: hypothetical protein VFX84_01365 [Candidatus Saccharimonadales bacterium]|nr:hypothetical protein [Candidatus Saccharimonadales bacterium]